MESLQDLLAANDREIAALKGTQRVNPSVFKKTQYSHNYPAKAGFSSDSTGYGITITLNSKTSDPPDFNIAFDDISAARVARQVDFCITDQGGSISGSTITRSFLVRADVATNIPSATIPAFNCYVNSILASSVNFT